MQAVIIKRTGQKGIVLEYGKRHTGKPLKLVQVDINGNPEWFLLSQVKVILWSAV